MRFEHGAAEKLEGGKALAFLTRANRDDLHLAAERRDFVYIIARNAVVGHDEHLAVKVEKLSRAGKRAVLDGYIVAFVRQIYGKSHAKHPFGLLF